MDPQLQDIAKQIADVVEKRLSRRFDDVEKRFGDVEKRFDDVQKRFDDVEKRFGDVEKRFDDVDERLGDVDERLGDVDERFDDFEKRIDGIIIKRLGEAERRLGEQFTGAEKRLAEQFSGAETRLAAGAKAHMEELRDFVRLTAEGYGATLERIERDLKDLNTKVDTKFSDHGKVLREHTLQIKALAKRRPTRSR